MIFGKILDIMSDIQDNFNLKITPYYDILESYGIEVFPEIGLEFGSFLDLINLIQDKNLPIGLPLDYQSLVPLVYDFESLPTYGSHKILPNRTIVVCEIFNNHFRFKGSATLARICGIKYIKNRLFYKVEIIEQGHTMGCIFNTKPNLIIYPIC